MKFKNDKERLDHYMDNVSIEPNTGCWLWDGATTDVGYGQIKYKGEQKGAHRVFYELIKGSIPFDLQLDHLCRVRNCVNPAHLEIVTVKTNILRGDTGKHNLEKTHCPKGHAYTYTDPNGWRKCRECKKLSDARYRNKMASYSNRSRKK